MIQKYNYTVENDGVTIQFKNQVKKLCNLTGIPYDKSHQMLHKIVANKFPSQSEWSGTIVNGFNITRTLIK